MECLVKYYISKLGSIPSFLEPYLEIDSLKRLKEVGYFCGMDYASKSVYNFREYITRYDHSLSVALLTYRLTHDKKATIAALYHDISTPCFSHVIDYMNKDYENQESTEEYTDKILRNDKKLNILLNKDGINIDEIIDFKRYSIVDNNRPKLCADRLDGIILTGIGWTKDINKEDIDNIINSLEIYNDEDGKQEIGFNNEIVANRVYEISDNINKYCHSNEDNYMMELLAKITKLAIGRKYIQYDSLFILNEKQLFEILRYSNDADIIKLLSVFKNIKLDDIPVMNIESLKNRDINPLVSGCRLKNNINNIDINLRIKMGKTL